MELNCWAQNSYYLHRPPMHMSHAFKRDSKSRSIDLGGGKSSFVNGAKLS